MNLRWALSRPRAMGRASSATTARRAATRRLRTHQANAGKRRARQSVDCRLAAGFAIDTYREAAERILSGEFRLHARLRCLAFELGEDQERIVAKHDGYRRRDDPVVHRRETVYASTSVAHGSRRPIT
jgi:hypothetical protein